MKSLAELAVMKEKARDQVAMRAGNFDFKIVVGMGTAGIDAGAREVLVAFAKEFILSHGGKNVELSRQNSARKANFRWCRSLKMEKTQ